MARRLARQLTALAIGVAVISGQAFAQSDTPITVFGFRLGEPHGLDACRMSGTYPVRPPEGACLNWPTAGVNRAALPQVLFSVKEAPVFVSGMELTLELIDGKVEGITFYTAGLSTEALVMRAMVDKFGPPVRTIENEVQTRAGAKFDAAIRIWKPPGASVMFAPAVGSISMGMVSVSTPAGDAAAAERRERAKKDSTARPL